MKFKAAIIISLAIGANALRLREGTKSKQNCPANMRPTADGYCEMK